MGEIRVITRRDAPEVLRLLSLRPIDNIVVSSRVRKLGVERASLGNDLVGYWENGTLVSFLSNGYSLHPVNATEAALDGFCTRLDHRRCGSIVGVRDETMGLWKRLCDHSFTQWASPREVRDHQKVLAISSDPLIPPDMSVQIVPTRYLDPYLDAATAMYTEEVGVAPLDTQGSYRDHVASMMMKGYTMGVLQSGRVVFKADVVADADQICQIGGVWLDPRWRGRGFSETLVAGVVALCRERFSTVTLYVNSYNHPALRCYAAIGFVQVGECASVYY